MSTSANTIFTGGSQFSNDFQQVIQRAVSFASLPMQQMQNDVAALQSQSTELNTLKSNFSALQSAVSALDTSLGLGSFASAVSTPTVASVTLSGAPTVGSYSLDVVSTGSYATATSNAGLITVAEPAKTSISDATVYTLTVGTKSTTIAPSDKSLSSLVTAINRSAAGVQATIVNVGSTASPDYRLSLQNSKLGQSAVQLTAYNGSAPGQTLLTKQSDGDEATYRINGIPKPPAEPLSSDSSTIAVAPGVSITLLDEGSTTISIARSPSVISNALTSFATAYNGVVSEINKNRGTGKGPLQGQYVVQGLSRALHRIATYSTGADGVSSLTAMGLQFDSNGLLSLDGKTFHSVSSGQLGALQDFLGSVQGGGFLRFANDSLNELIDSTKGVIHSSLDSISSQISRENNAISAQQDRIANLQLRLNKQMAAADSAIAAMEQQYSFLSNMFLSMRVNAQNNG